MALPRPSPARKWTPLTCHRGTSGEIPRPPMGRTQWPLIGRSGRANSAAEDLVASGGNPFEEIVSKG